jgi:hypothetical protein
MKFPNEIFVLNGDYRKVHTCDTTEQAATWIEMSGVPEDERDWDYSIDGTPRAWYEQTGECGCLKGETCEGCRP